MRLEELLLDKTEVTDACVPHVSALVNLDHLSLTETGVTDSGVARLRMRCLDVVEW